MFMSCFNIIRSEIISADHVLSKLGSKGCLGVRKNKRLHVLDFGLNDPNTYCFILNFKVFSQTVYPYYVIDATLLFICAGHVIHKTNSLTRLYSSVSGRISSFPLKFLRCPLTCIGSTGRYHPV
jgi:hypothetical protein